MKDGPEALLERPELTFTAAGVDALLMQFGRTMNPCLPDFLAQLRETILSDLSSVVLEVVPAYTTLLVYYEPRLVRIFDLEQALTQLSDATPWACTPWSGDPEKNESLIQVPVCYDRRVAPDLQAISEATGMSEDDITKCHTDPIYQVYALGFAPGFAYLGEVPKPLQIPRLAEPRTHVPAGSVGIAGAQTAVYPDDSPGGWHLIGRSPFRWFDPQSTPMTPVQVGDRIRFYGIEYDEFEALWSKHHGEKPE